MHPAKNTCGLRWFFTCLCLTPCVSVVTTDLEWKIIYVGSAESEEYDQTLDTVVVGPLCAGRHMFVFEVSLILFKFKLTRILFQRLHACRSM